MIRASLLDQALALAEDLNILRAGKTIVDDVVDGFATAAIDQRGSLGVTYADGSIAALSFNWADGDIHLDVGREDRSTVGTADDDELEGTSRADLLIGGEGNDEIEGKSGNDELSGEGGDDELEGGSGRDALYGDRGNDTLEGGSGNDKLWGGSDNDHLDGDSGDDMLSGNDGDDRLVGGSGVDRILGGAGVDRMTGDSGADTFVFHLGDGADVITDFRVSGRSARHHDVIEVSSDISGFDSFADVEAAASQVGRDTVIDFGNGDTLTLEHVRLSALQASDFAFI